MSLPSSKETKNASGETIFGERLEPLMVDCANHLAKREAEMPHRRRSRSFLRASNRAEYKPTRVTLAEDK
jgi:hypothetical protein